MISYHYFEKKIFDWLMTKHRKDPFFTFSIREDESEGAIQDIFIGTKNSQYFGFTCWNIPVWYHSASTDLIDFIFKIARDKFFFKLQYNMSKEPEQMQNKANLSLNEILYPLLEKLAKEKGYKITEYPSRKDKKKTLYFDIQPNIAGYKNINELLLSFEVFIDDVIPVVNKAISLNKENFPLWQAHTFDRVYFNSAVDAMIQRRIKYGGVLSESLMNYEDNQISEKENSSDQSIMNKESNLELSAETFTSHILKEKKSETVGIIENNGGGESREISTPRMKEVTSDLTKRKTPFNPTNIIYYGVDGVGKSYQAKLKAISLLEGKKISEYQNITEKELSEKLHDFKDSERLDIIQLHKYFGYSHFVEGVEPLFDAISITTQYRIERGVLKTLCEKAKKNIDEEHVLLIENFEDKNLIQDTFGETLSLISSDTREHMKSASFVTLPFSREKFSIPANLHFITTATDINNLPHKFYNTFLFEEIISTGEEITVTGAFDVDMVKLLTTVNNRISFLLGEEKVLGHTYFLALIDSENPLETLRDIFAKKIIPILENVTGGDNLTLGKILGNQFVHKTVVKTHFAIGFEDSCASEKILYRITKPEDWDITTFQSIYK